MRLLFLCDARIQESLSEGVWEGEARLPKNNRNNVFLKLSTDFTGGGGGVVQHFTGGGVQHFQGGGVQMLISIKTHITCDFLEGVLIPCPPSGSAHV